MLYEVVRPEHVIPPAEVTLTLTEDEARYIRAALSHINTANFRDRLEDTFGIVVTEDEAQKMRDSVEYPLIRSGVWKLLRNPSAK